MKKLVYFFVLLFFATSAFAQVIAKDSMSDKKGETRSKGSYSIVQNGNSVKLEISFNVRKSGMSGKGRGVIALQILDDNWEPVKEFKKGLTVGAKVPEGTNDKDWDKNITLTGNMAKKIINEGAAIAFTVITDKDDIGIPTSLDGWKDALSEHAGDLAAVFGSMDKGSSKDFGNWKVFKIK